MTEKLNYTYKHYWWTFEANDKGNGLISLHKVKEKLTGFQYVDGIELSILTKMENNSRSEITVDGKAIT